MGKMTSRYRDGLRDTDSPLLAPTTAQDDRILRARSNVKARRLLSFIVRAGGCGGQCQPHPYNLSLWVWLLQNCPGHPSCYFISREFRQRQ